MKKYYYHGDSLLAFTHADQDYLVDGKGPHELPEDATPVISAVGISLLEELPDQPTKTIIPPTQKPR